MLGYRNIILVLFVAVSEATFSIICSNCLPHTKGGDIPLIFTEAVEQQHLYNQSSLAPVPGLGFIIEKLQPLVTGKL